MSRFVLDANIVLAALAGRAGAPPALLLAGVHNGDLEAVACPLLIGEIRENLGKPYFRARISEQEAGEAVEAYEAVCVMFADPAATKPVLRDPEDDYLPASRSPRMRGRSSPATATCSTTTGYIRPRSKRAPRASSCGYSSQGSDRPVTARAGRPSVCAAC